MKLNPDCIRGILLTVEEKCNFDTPWEYDEILLSQNILLSFPMKKLFIT